MTKINRIILLIITTSTLFSCGGTTRNLLSGQFSKSEKYKMNSYSGCCGCYAEYFNIYKQGERQEQVIYKYNCGSPGMPTKFTFNYDETGNLTYCDKFVATIVNDFETALTDSEKELFSLLDKNKTLIIGNKRIRYSEIKGFRRPNIGEMTHSFPLFRGGSTVTIR